MVFIVKGHSLVVFADTIFQYKEAVRMVPLFFAVAICATAAMNDIVVPSVSHGGKKSVGAKFTSGKNMGYI